MSITIERAEREAPAADYLYCPLCSGRVSTGENYVCTGHPMCHAPVRLSWQWKSLRDYEAMYESAAYHTVEQSAGGQVEYTDPARYDSAYRCAMNRLQMFEWHFGGKKQRILDVGAGNMAFVDAMRNAGHDAYGLDPNPLRSDCERGTAMDVKGQWDVITLLDVIEHLPDSRMVLKHLRSCLAPNGLLIVETPEWDSPHHKVEGSAWRHHRDRQHLCLFSRQAIEDLYEQCGLTAVLFYRPRMGELGKMSHILKRTDEIARLEIVGEA